MTTIVVVATIIVAVIIIGVVVARRRRSAREHGRRLEPAQQVGDDLAYPYYLDEANVRQIATGLNVELPVRQQVAERSQVTSQTQVLGAQDEETTTRELGGEINLAALARDIRLQVPSDKMSADVALLPSMPPHGRRRGARRTEAIRAQKMDEFRDIAKANKLILLRGHFQQFAIDEAKGTITLGMTHLSAEEFDAAQSRGTGNSAEMPMPEGIAIRVHLATMKACTDSGRAAFEQGTVFFGEAIAHTPNYDESTGTFGCTACAVWGCPGPQNGDEDVGV
jgi:hypothetical protein